MLSITWNEVTGHQSSENPSPMALSRWDWDVDLFFEGHSAENHDHHRIFWHPGIGMWQLDDIGLGGNMAAGKFSSGSTADTVAPYIKNRICDNLPIYTAWYGCENGTCAADYDNIYNPSTGLQNIDHSANIGEWGGTKIRSCRVPAVGATSFPCKYVDVDNADGYTGSWDYTRQGNNSQGLAPVAKPFYVFNLNNSAGNPVEYRVWFTQDTGLAQTLTMKRVYGNNSRTSLTYSNDFILCDLDRGSGGTCSY